MKTRTLVILIFCFSFLAIGLVIGDGISGVVEKSPYDQTWSIIVTNCQGITTIYSDCAITNQGEYVVTFIPNAGNMPTGRGKTIKIFRNDCTQIIMEQQ